MDLETLSVHPLLNGFDRLTYGQDPNRFTHRASLG